MFFAGMTTFLLQPKRIHLLLFRKNAAGAALTAAVFLRNLRLPSKMQKIVHFWAVNINYNSISIKKTPD
jgi:hypothetical protein